MPEIEFSLSFRSLPYAETIRALLDRFEAQSGINVNLDLSYPSRADLNRIALYHHGPDVSEIASTWVNDLIAMHALRPFSDAEINRIGKPEEFVPGACSSCHQLGEKENLAFPWMVEATMIHYRKDLFAKAGVNPETAFRSLADLTQAAAQLRDSGVDVPVEMPYKWLWFDQLHALSGFVWGNGGEFCNDTGKSVLFDRPEAIQAMCEYFSLLTYMTPAGAKLFLNNSEGSLFRQGKSAVLFNPHQHKVMPESASLQPGAASQPVTSELPAEVAENWGIASYPKETYLGGANLVVWKHTRYDTAALELVRYLSSVEVEVALFQQTYQLPGRLAGLNHPAVQQDEMFRTAAESAKTGRTYPSVPLWGLIEDHLVRALSNIQTTLASDPNAQVEATVRKFIEPVARRMNLTLSQ